MITLALPELEPIQKKVARSLDQLTRSLRRFHRALEKAAKK